MKRALADDIVISAYSLLKGSPVGKVRWHRLVLDESTELKASKAQKTVEVAAIKAHRRWCLSGTPMPNAPACLEGQFAALQMYPYDKARVFNARLNAMSNGMWVGESTQVHASPQPLLKLLAICAVRHRKDGLSMADGEALVKLPPMTIEARLIDASRDEAASYAELHQAIKERIAFLTRAGALRAKVSQVSSLLLRLRQACDHQSFATTSLKRLALAQQEARQAASKANIIEKTVEEVLADVKASQGGAPGDKQKKVNWLEELLAPFDSPTAVTGSTSTSAPPDSSAVTLPECSICMVCIQAGQTSTSPHFPRHYRPCV